MREAEASQQELRAEVEEAEQRRVREAAASQQELHAEVEEAEQRRLETFAQLSAN